MSKNRILSIIVTIVMITSLSIIPKDVNADTTLPDSAESVNVVVDGQSVSFDEIPFIQDDVLWLPTLIDTSNTDVMGDEVQSNDFGFSIGWGIKGIGPYPITVSEGNISIYFYFNLTDAQKMSINLVDSSKFPSISQDDLMASTDYVAFRYSGVSGFSFEPSIPLKKAIIVKDGYTCLPLGLIMNIIGFQWTNYDSTTNTIFLSRYLNPMIFG